LIALVVQHGNTGLSKCYPSLITYRV